VLSDPKVLILDEATSSVDPGTEQRLQEALERRFAGRTMLIIAHRLNALRNVDRVLVLEDGKVSGQGTREELARENRVFAKLYGGAAADR